MVMRHSVTGSKIVVSVQAAFCHVYPKRLHRGFRQVSGSSPLVGSILFRSLRISPPLPTVQLLYH